MRCLLLSAALYVPAWAEGAEVRAGVGWPEGPAAAVQAFRDVSWGLAALVFPPVLIFAEVCVLCRWRSCSGVTATS